MYIVEGQSVVRVYKQSHTLVVTLVQSDASIPLMLKLYVISCSLTAIVTLDSSDNTSLTDQLSEHGMDLSFVRYNNMPHSCLLDKQLGCFLYTIPLTHLCKCIFTVTISHSRACALY